MPIAHNFGKEAEQSYFCKHCALAYSCLPLGLSGEEIESLDQIIGKRLVLRQKEDLFRKGNQFHSIFAVRSGSIKTYTTDIEGAEQVLGFYFPGEVLGLDAVYEEVYLSNAVALETSSICRIPFDDITLLAAKVPSLLKQLFRMMSKEIASGLFYLGNYSAEERLAIFLSNLSERFKRRGLSETNFILSMSRSDIANYLHLATETISRLLTQFQRERWLKVSRRQIQLINLSKIKQIAKLI